MGQRRGCGRGRYHGQSVAVKYVVAFIRAVVHLVQTQVLEPIPERHTGAKARAYLPKVLNKGKGRRPVFKKVVEHVRICAGLDEVCGERPRY